MKILAIDTVNEICSVALWNNGAVCTFFEKCTGRHSQLILPMIQTVLNQNNTTIGSLNAIAFNRGPGSFTGVRVGTSVVQGLALGAKLPVIGVSTFIIMAQIAWCKTGISKALVAVDAYMNEVYWAEYKRDGHGLWYGKETEILLKYDDVNQRLKTHYGKWAIIGNGWKKIKLESINNKSLSLIDVKITSSHAKDMLSIASYLFTHGYSTSVEYIEPIYLGRDEF